MSTIVSKYLMSFIHFICISFFLQNRNIVSETLIAGTLYFRVNVLYFFDPGKTNIRYQHLHFYKMKSGKTLLGSLLNLFFNLVKIFFELFLSWYSWIDSLLDQNIVNKKMNGANVKGKLLIVVKGLETAEGTLH